MKMWVVVPQLCVHDCPVCRSTSVWDGSHSSPPSLAPSTRRRHRSWRATLKESASSSWTSSDPPSHTSTGWSCTHTLMLHQLHVNVFTLLLQAWVSFFFEEGLFILAPQQLSENKEWCLGDSVSYDILL